MAPFQPKTYRRGQTTRFSHREELASPGYYAVKLPKLGTLVELTATPRVGVHRYTFGKGKTPHLILDVANALGGRRSRESQVRVLPEAKKIEGLTAAQLGPKQYALMSPWMLAYRASESAFEQIQKPVNDYLEHWFNLVENGLPADAVPAGDAKYFANRDQLNRNAIFDPTVDKVWAQVERLIGAEMGEKLRGILKNQDLEK